MSPYQKNKTGYQQVQIGSASPEKLLLMVYDGALKHLKAAKMMSERGQMTKCLSSSMKAAEFVTELIATLNFEASPDVAGNLQALYMYIINQIKEFLRTEKVAHLDEAINIISGLKATWEEAFANQEAEALKKVG